MELHDLRDLGLLVDWPLQVLLEAFSVYYVQIFEAFYDVLFLIGALFSDAIVNSLPQLPCQLPKEHNLKRNIGNLLRVG